MKTFTSPILSFLAVSLVVTLASGCSTTKVTPDASNQGGARIAKPERIVVFPFAATTADLSPQDQGNYSEPSTPPSAEELQKGRELGQKVAERLVEKINDMGMTAVVGTSYMPARVGDILIRGHFESIDEGSATKRIVIGFGSGNADLKTVVSAYEVTPAGPRRIGGGSVDSTGGKGPGLLVPAIVTVATANPIGLVVSGAVKAEGQISGRTTIDGAANRTADAIAERLEKRFKDEGWI